ncbi:unnamed protein product, partial [Discosporangium mesarthrocarpum]
ITSPPPTRPAPTAGGVISQLRQEAVGGLPRGPSDLQDILRGKRGRDQLGASVLLSEEVAARFPKQAAQAERLSRVEQNLDRKICATRRRLLSKADSVEWRTMTLRTWLMAEVVTEPSP